MNQAPKPSSSPWLPIAGLFAIYFVFGATVGVMAPMVDEISADLNLSRSTMGSILGAWALLYIFTAVPAGVVLDRIGVRLAMSLGAVAIIISLGLRAVSTGPTSLFAAVAVFGIGGPLVSVGAPKLVSALFADDARRLPMGITAAGPGLGSALSIALTNPVLLPLANDEWREVLLYLAALGSATLVMWLLVTRDLPLAATVTKRTKRSDLDRLLRITVLRWVLALSVPFFFFGHALSNWFIEILTEFGLGDERAGYFAAASTLAGIVGGVVISRMVPSGRRAGSLATVFFVIAACIAVVPTLAPLPLLITLITLGFTRAAVIPLVFLIVMDDPQISVRDMGLATGLFFAFGQIGAFLGPLTVGLVADLRSGFTMPMLIISGVAAIAGLVALALRSDQVAANSLLSAHIP